MHKLACRLSLLRARVVAIAAVVLSAAMVFSCERPITEAGVDNNSVAVFVVTPNAVTLKPNQMQDFVAVGLTAAGDTASIGVTWSTTGGSVDTSSVGGRHYAHYRNANCGTYRVTATSHPGERSDAATVTVGGCLVPVASVSVTPASASVNEGRTVPLTATPRDASGNPLSGRTVTWASSTTNIATVSASGLVAGGTAGSATSTATSGGQSGTSSVTGTRGPGAAGAGAPAPAGGGGGRAPPLPAPPQEADGT